jgi:gas vesicle protein
MRKEPSSTCGNLLLALLGGATLGAVAVALTTPKTGREVRATLRGTLDRLRGRLDDEDPTDVSAHEAMFI